MTGHRTEWPQPSWQPSGVDAGRRRALIGLSALVVSAMGAERAWAQSPRSCVLTPEAGEGPGSSSGIWRAQRVACPQRTGR